MYIINVVESKYKVVENGKTQVKNLKIVLENSLFSSLVVSFILTTNEHRIQLSFFCLLVSSVSVSAQKKPYRSTPSTDTHV